MKSLKAILFQLDENRSAPLSTILGEIRNIPSFEKMVNMHGMFDGFTALYLGKDGKYYEIEIRPAESAKSHDEFTGNEERRQKRAASAVDDALSKFQR